MRVKIKPTRAVGEVRIPASKSMAHRLMIAAAMADGKSVIDGVTLCDDVLATADCLRAMGVTVEIDGGRVTVIGKDMRTAVANGPLCCRESGSTLRFFIPIAALSGGEVRFVGSERLLERPQTVYEDMARDGIFNLTRGDGSITVKGPFRASDVYVRSDVSSQFITGLLFVLPYLGYDARIHVTTDIESRSYIDMTLSAMREFSVDASWEDERTLLVRRGSGYRAKDVTVEGDYSASAFIEAFGLIGGDVRAAGLSETSLQGDRIYREYFKKLDTGTPVLSLKDCPDLAPILFTLAALKHGARFTDTKRLRIKESDRAAVMAEELAKFGADVRVHENEVEVVRRDLHTPREILSGHNDHRIVMSLAVLATVYGGEIEGAEACKKSYPDFFEDLKKIGIEYEAM